VEGVAHKHYMDNFYPSLDLYDNLNTRTINYCGTVRQNRKGMPGDSDNKTIKLKQTDIHARERDVLTEIIWKDKQGMSILTNMHKSPAEGKICHECGRFHKLAIVEEYSRYMNYVDKGDRMGNSYSISHRTWKRIKKLFSCFWI
jgi:hypothetical protein